MLHFFHVEPETKQRLEVVMHRLYDDRPLSGDQRRDLANTMFALLNQFVEIKERRD